MPYFVQFNGKCIGRYLSYALISKAIQNMKRNQIIGSIYLTSMSRRCDGYYLLVSSLDNLVIRVYICRCNSNKSNETYCM